MQNSFFRTLIILTTSLVLLTTSQNLTCHYTCASCLSSQYYSCISCPLGRGIIQKPTTPFAGMCYCSSFTDESPTGECLPNSTVSIRSLIWSFIILTLILSSFMLLTRGFRYYLIKTIQDLQQLSLIIFINMYFPQQFDLFLTQMYRFNVSSFLFESMTAGGLFVVGEDGAVVSVDGMNVPGKYNLLFKTANFFSNMFTWIVVVLILIGFMVIVRCLKGKFANKDEQKTVEKVGEEHMDASQANISQNISQFMQGSPQKNQIIKEKYQVKKHPRSNPYSYTFPNLITKLHHILTFNFLIIFVYLSLIQININIFTQIKNLKFVSGFAGFGSIMSIVFLGLQIAGFAWLVYKCRTEIAKPDWMQDHSYTAVLYLIRTNYKAFSKYFFFWSSIKKILFALIITACYDSPYDAILGFSILQLLYLCFSLYLQPFEKRYLRLHFYICEVLKLFLFLSLINYVEKYKEYTALVDVTEIFFVMFGFVFGFHFFAVLIGLIVERKLYWHAMKKIYYKVKRACNNGETCQGQIENNEIITGYFNYVLEKIDNQTQPETPKMENIGKDLKEFDLSQSINMTQNEKNQQQEDQEPENQWKKYFYVYKNYEK